MLHGISESNKAATLKISPRWHHRSRKRLGKPASTSLSPRLTSRFWGPRHTNPSFLFLILVQILLHRCQSIQPTMRHSNLEGCSLYITGPDKANQRAILVSNPVRPSFLMKQKTARTWQWTPAQARVACADLEHLSKCLGGIYCVSVTGW